MVDPVAEIVIVDEIATTDRMAEIVILVEMIVTVGEEKIVTLMKIATEGEKKIDMVTVNQVVTAIAMIDMMIDTIGIETGVMMEIGEAIEDTIEEMMIVTDIPEREMVKIA